MKILVANGRGKLLAGAIDLPGAAVGDVVTGVLAQTVSGKLEYTEAGWFETVISVADQVQQLLPLMMRFDQATNTHYGPDGSALANALDVSARPQAKDPGTWRFVFFLRPTATASADGAIGITEGDVRITKATAAALTLAAPTSGTDDGKRLTIVSETAAAHTVTNASPGFNDGGSGSDVATFSGAKGDNLQLVARGGKWFVLSKTGVTLA